MANSCGRFRTNYFRVTDAGKLKKIIAKCQSTDGEEVELFDSDFDGEKLYGFGCSAQLQGYYNEEAEEYDFNAFANDLQTVVAPGDAIIIMEIGYEKLRYVCASAFIITSETKECLDFIPLALQKAAEMLRNPDYQTRVEY